MEEGWSDFKILIHKLTGKILLGRPRGKWEDNIRMNHKEIDSAQDRDYCKTFVNAELNLRVS